MNDHRQDFRQIADDLVMGDLEDRCVRIGVDGDDLGRLIHAGAVLDGAGDSRGDIQPRADGRPRLSDLVFAGYPARINRRPRSAEFAAQQIGQIA